MKIEEAKHIILCEKSEERRKFIRTHYPNVQVVHPDECKEIVGKTSENGGVDGCDCQEILRLIEQGKIDTTPLITHRFPLSEIEEAYKAFENRLEGVIKVALVN